MRSINVIKIFVLAFSLVLCNLVMAQVGEFFYDQGSFYFKKHDYKMALEYYHLAADKQHAKAHKFIGIMYADGLGIREDGAEALRWLIKATNLLVHDKSHLAETQYIISVIYGEGRRNISINKSERMKWLRRAADGGYPKAQTALGWYHHLRGEARLARKYYQAAADQGDENGKFLLSRLTWDKVITMELDRATGKYDSVQ